MNLKPKIRKAFYMDPQGRKVGLLLTAMPDTEDWIVAEITLEDGKKIDPISDPLACAVVCAELLDLLLESPDIALH